MRYLALLAMLCFFGCGGSDGPVAASAPVTNPTSQRLVLTAENAQHVASISDELLVPSGRNSVELAGGNLSLIEIDGIAGALVELPLAYPVLVQDQSGQFAGPGGGSATLTVNGRDVSIVFTSFVTADGSLLTGSVNMTGLVQGIEGEISATFAGFVVTDVDGRFQIDGPVTLMLDRVQEPDRYVERVRRVLNATVTELDNGGSVRMLDLHSESDIEVEAGFQAGTSTVSGTLSFANFEGLTGEMLIVPDLPFTFTVEHATLISEVTSGRVFYEGEGTVRRSILSPNIFETAVRPTGSSEFQVVGTTDITDIDAP